MTTASSNSSYMHDYNVIGLSHLNCIGDDGDRSHQREDSSVASFDSFQSNFEILAIKKVLAEGWLHKKGSGQDMLSSTEWKSRWAKLSLVEMKDHDIEIPTLLIYWYPFSSKPSICIPLNSSVINPIDNETRSNRYPYCFEVVPSEYKKCGDDKKDDSVVRTFSAPLKERNQWVHATTLALGIFEKKKAKQKIERIRSQLPPSPPRNKNYKIPGKKFAPSTPSQNSPSLDESIMAIAKLNVDGVPPKAGVPSVRTAPRNKNYKIPSKKVTPITPNTRQVSPSLDESIMAVSKLNVDGVPPKAGVPSARTVASLKTVEKRNESYQLMSNNIKQYSKLQNSANHQPRLSKVQWKPPTHLESSQNKSHELSHVYEKEQKSDESFPNCISLNASTAGKVSDLSACTHTSESSRSSLQKDQIDLSAPIPLRATLSSVSPRQSLNKVKSFYNQNKGIMKVAPDNTRDLSRRVQSLPVRRVRKLPRESSRNIVRD